MRKLWFMIMVVVGLAIGSTAIAEEGANCCIKELNDMKIWKITDEMDDKIHYGLSLYEQDNKAVLTIYPDGGFIISTECILDYSKGYVWPKFRLDKHPATTVRMFSGGVTNTIMSTKFLMNDMLIFMMKDYNILRIQVDCYRNPKTVLKFNLNGFKIMHKKMKDISRGELNYG